MVFLIKYVDNDYADHSRGLTPRELALCAYKEFQVDASDYYNALIVAENMLGTTEWLGNGQYMIEPIGKHD